MISIIMYKHNKGKIFTGLTHISLNEFARNLSNIPGKYTQPTAPNNNDRNRALQIIMAQPSVVWVEWNCLLLPIDWFIKILDDPTVLMCCCILSFRRFLSLCLKMSCLNVSIFGQGRLTLQLNAYQLSYSSGDRCIAWQVIKRSSK